MGSKEDFVAGLKAEPVAEFRGKGALSAVDVLASRDWFDARRREHAVEGSTDE